jgi:aminotransferase
VAVAADAIFQAGRLFASVEPVGSRTLAARVEEAQARGVEVLPLSPYPLRPLPRHVVEAAERAVVSQAESPSRGLGALRLAIAQRLGAELGRSVDPESQVLVTNGAMQALNIVFRALLNPGDQVLVPSPCYFFHGCIRLAGGTAVHVPMREADGFAWDIAAIQRAVTPRTRAIVVSSPVNPTGYVLSTGELRALAQIAAEHGLLIVSDESYDKLVYDGAVHLSIGALPEAADRTVVIRSFTKSYAMPAWRVGYLVAPPAGVELFTRALEWEILHPSHVAQAAACAAMMGDGGWLADVPTEFAALRDRLMTGLAGIPWLACVTPRGGPFAFLNVSRRFASSEAASEALLEQGIPTTPGWYCQSDAHVRLAFGTTLATIDRVVQRLAAMDAGTG